MPNNEASVLATDSRIPFGTRIVVAAFFVQAVAIGMTLVSYPVFMSAVEAEFSVSRTAMSLGIPALLVSGALLAPWIGRRIDVGSPRAVMIAGAMLIGAGYAGLFWSPSFAWAAGFWILAVGTGQTMLGPLPATTVLARWFVRRRGTAIAIAATGTTFGGALAPPIVERLISAYGWREATLVLGVTAVMVGIPPFGSESSRALRRSAPIRTAPPPRPSRPDCRPKTRPRARSFETLDFGSWVCLLRS